MESEFSVFFLFTSAKRANVKPEMIPEIEPWVILFEKSKSGITRTMPVNTVHAIKISMAFNFSLKNKGSRKVTKRGKVENVTRPIATVEI